MEYNLYENNKNINEENLEDKQIDVFKKMKNKKKKIKACQIQVKEFFSDDEDENYKNKRNEIIDKYKNQRKVQLKQYYDSTKNSILYYKEQLQKKSTIDQTPNKKSEKQIFKEESTSKNIGKKSKIKKVNFPKNFVNIIEIESYKKYNSENYFLSQKNEENKAEAKCCLIW